MGLLVGLFRRWAKWIVVSSGRGLRVDVMKVERWTLVKETFDGCKVRINILFTYNRGFL